MSAVAAAGRWPPVQPRSEVPAAAAGARHAPLRQRQDVEMAPNSAAALAERGKAVRRDVAGPRRLQRCARLRRSEVLVAKQRPGRLLELAALPVARAPRPTANHLLQYFDSAGMCCIHLRTARQESWQPHGSSAAVAAEVAGETFAVAFEVLFAVDSRTRANQWLDLLKTIVDVVVVAAAVGRVLHYLYHPYLPGVEFEVYMSLAVVTCQTQYRFGSFAAAVVVENNAVVDYTALLRQC